MSRWILEGLRAGKLTTRYPSQPETTPGVTPGLPVALHPAPDRAPGEAPVPCPTGALPEGGGARDVRQALCVHCMRCQHASPPVAEWSTDFEWTREASRSGEAPRPLPRPFAHSLHLRVVDAGACGACLHELALLGQPHYNMHRLGFFVTPSPRKADLLLVAGPVTPALRGPLREAYEAMPEPRRVIAVGACAISGGVFGPSYAAGAGVAEVLPVDWIVPGCPPPPAALLHALLVASGRAKPLPAQPTEAPGGAPRIDPQAEASPRGLGSGTDAEAERSEQS